MSCIKVGSFPGLLRSRILFYHACLLLDNMSTFHTQSCRVYREKRWTDARTDAHPPTHTHTDRPTAIIIHVGLCDNKYGTHPQCELNWAKTHQQLNVYSGVLVYLYVSSVWCQGREKIPCWCILKLMANSPLPRCPPSAPYKWPMWWPAAAAAALHAAVLVGSGSL